MNLTPPLVTISYCKETDMYVVQSVFINGLDLKPLGQKPTFLEALKFLYEVSTPGVTL